MSPKKKKLSQSFLSVQSERKEGRNERTKGGWTGWKYNVPTALGIRGQTEEEDGREDGKRRGEEWGGNDGSLGDFLFFKIPQGRALIHCVRAFGFGVMGTCKVTSLSVLSLGRDYCLLLGCVASSQPYYCRCWPGYPLCVYTSLTNTVPSEETLQQYQSV